MPFDEILAQVTALLLREGRVSYRALKRRFTLDDEYFEAVKAELIQAKWLAKDEEGARMGWVGDEPRAAANAGCVCSNSLSMKSFHRAWTENVHECLLKLSIGRVSR